uniref:Uncharacterized protein n=1 Tax=Glossina palpalis gambiensis TaxID=67801 RepID=A0A1B0BS39_9MUSC
MFSRVEIPTGLASTTAVQAISISKSKIRKRESDCHSRRHNHSLTSSPVAVDNSQRFHNANDCSNNGQSIMATTTTVLSTPLASFNEYSNINNNGNPKATATNNSTACPSNYNSNFKLISDNSGSVCHSNISEMNNSTKIKFQSIFWLLPNNRSCIPLVYLMTTH